jgi:hypothetical protein
VIEDKVEWKYGLTAKPYKMILQWNLTQKKMRACGMQTVESLQSNVNLALSPLKSSRVMPHKGGVAEMR